MTNHYTLAEARANINDETCKKNGWEVLDGYPPWCSTHDQPYLPDDPFCVTAPAELVAVAAQLHATVERVHALAGRWADVFNRAYGTAALNPTQSTTTQGERDLMRKFAIELRDAINGKAVTE